MPPSPVLPQVQPLPGAEAELATDHGNLLRRPSHRAAQVRGHVVGPLEGMRVAAVALRREAGEPCLEVVTSGGIGVLLDHEGAARVSHEDVAQAGLDPTSSHEVRDGACDFDQPLTRCVDGQDFLKIRNLG